MLFEMHPSHQNISFPIIEPYTLKRRYGERVSETELDFLGGLLHLDPKKRLDGPRSLTHEYLRGLTAADAETQHLLPAQELKCSQ
jgi:hypothetical protein